MKEKTCEDRIESALADRLEQFEKGELDGLCFEYIDDVDRGGCRSYWRWQLSWGGPSDEFRLFKDGTMKYWFFDWYDGASRPVNNIKLLHHMNERADR